MISYPFKLKFTQYGMNRPLEFISSSSCGQIKTNYIQHKHSKLKTTHELFCPNSPIRCDCHWDSYSATASPSLKRTVFSSEFYPRQRVLSLLLTWNLGEFVNVCFSKMNPTIIFTNYTFESALMSLSVVGRILKRLEISFKN
jgi:hypothetical protein